MTFYVKIFGRKDADKFNWRFETKIQGEVLPINLRLGFKMELFCSLSVFEVNKL